MAPESGAIFNLNLSLVFLNYYNTIFTDQSD
jgi:hypothetical protein